MGRGAGRSKGEGEENKTCRVGGHPLCCTCLHAANDRLIDYRLIQTDGNCHSNRLATPRIRRHPSSCMHYSASLIEPPPAGTHASWTHNTIMHACMHGRSDLSRPPLRRGQTTKNDRRRRPLDAVRIANLPTTGRSQRRKWQTYR